MIAVKPKHIAANSERNRLIVELCICWCCNNLKIIYNARTEQYESYLNKRFNLNLLSLNFD